MGVLTRPEADAIRAAETLAVGYALHRHFGVEVEPDGIYVRRWGSDHRFRLELIGPTSEQSNS